MGRLHTNYEIRWKNYRRFEDTGWLVIKPLTVIIGANNSGKSSLLSPLLLLDQTLSSSDGEAALVTRGKVLDGGNYRDFVHRHDTEKDITFCLRFHTHPLPKKPRPIGTYPPGGLELVFGAGDTPQQVQLRRWQVADMYSRKYATRQLLANGDFSLLGSISVDKMNPQEKKAVQNSRPTNFLFSPTTTLSALAELDKPNADRPKQTKQFTEAFSHYLKLVGYVYGEMRGVFDNMSYVGPLRQKMHRFYRVSAEAPRTVGSQGQNVANLFRHSQASLKKEVNRWVKRFEFGDELTLVDQTEDFFQLHFKTDSDSTNVTDAGFGASQVLPLIIQAFSAPPDSLTLAEQPEIHLNPRLQAELADLFVQMANTEHRIVVETHSEHLITRLRTLVAAGKIEADNVALYFVEKIEGISRIRQVPIDSNGAITSNDWPVGFFADSLRESLALARAQAKNVAAHGAKYGS